MFGNNNDLGAAMFKTWTEEQRKGEIEKLVEGYRNGVPVGILCTMTETIAGDRKKAKKYLKLFLTKAERSAEVAAASDAMKSVVTAFLG